MTREGRRFLEDFLNNALPKMLGLSKVPGARGFRSRKVIASLGEVTLRRAYTPGRVCPMDRALGLECGCTAEAAAMLCFAAAMSESYDKGEAAVRKLAGLDVPGRTIQRLVNVVSVQMKAANADTAQEPFPEGSVVNTQMDMTGVKVRPEDLEDTKGRDGDPSKKQVKVGGSFRQVRSADGKLHMEKSSIGHLVAFEGPAAFGERMRKWLDGRGLGKCSAHVVTSDGAQWIWDLVETEFPDAVQIVDFYHASEHLMELCRLLHPEEDGAMARKTFDMRRRMLNRNGAGCLIRYFEANGPFSPNATEIYDKLDYFRNNESRMRYGEFKKAGYVIGSGAVEGSCRSLVNQRADLSGQWWHPRGAVNILRIRGMIIDGIHEKYWRSRGLARFKRAA